MESLYGCPQRALSLGLKQVPSQHWGPGSSPGSATCCSVTVVGQRTHGVPLRGPHLLVTAASQAGWDTQGYQSALNSSASIQFSIRPAAGARPVSWFLGPVSSSAKEDQ